VVSRCKKRLQKVALVNSCLQIQYFSVNTSMVSSKIIKLK
jgi:hypothetical protein